MRKKLYFKQIPNNINLKICSLKKAIKFNFNVSEKWFEISDNETFAF